MKARRSAELVVLAHQGDWQRAEACLSKGADPNASGVRGVSALMMAAERGSMEGLNLLLSRKADVNACDKVHGATALMHACGPRSVGLASAPSVITALLEARAEVDAVDAKARSALMAAAECGSARVAEELLEAGANFSLRAWTEEPDPDAMELKRKVIRTFMGGHTKNALGEYCRVRRREDAEEYQRQKKEAQEEWAKKWQAMYADSPGPPDDEEEEGLDLNSNSDWEQGQQEEDDNHTVYGEGTVFISKVAPLRKCDMAKEPPSAEALEEYRQRSGLLRRLAPRLGGTGDTALTLAAKAGSAEVCQLLLFYRADPMVADAAEDQPLLLAARAGHLEAVRAILRSVPDPAGRSEALAAAINAGHQAVGSLLSGHEILAA